MVSFFKQKYHDLNQNTNSIFLSKTEIDSQLDIFIKQMYGDILSSEKVSANDKNMIKYTVLTILFSHRVDKNDRFIVEIKESGIKLNFDIIRNVMYKYSEQSRDALLDSPFYPFMFIHFASNP